MSQGVRPGALGWLLDSDPAIRWQVMRDLLDAPEAEWSRERARVGREGWGSRLLALQQPDGHWDVTAPNFTNPAAERWWSSLPAGCRGTLFPEWTSTTWSLVLLRAFGLEPGSTEAQAAVGRVRENCLWEHAAEPFFAGEVEPCINGRTVALGAYFGEDVSPIVERLLGEQMADGGWNCEQENGSTRGSFNTTIEVLEGLLEYERAIGGPPAVSAARRRGEEYLLQRGLLRRLSTGELIDPSWTRLPYPAYWHYDVLRGLDYFRAAGAVPDQRMAEAVGLIIGKQDAEGRWPLDAVHPGRVHFALDDGEGRPGRWNTLRALRVLRWYSPP
jgi:hypothetical protein